MDLAPKHLYGKCPSTVIIESMIYVNPLHLAEKMKRWLGNIRVLRSHNLLITT